MYILNVIFRAYQILNARGRKYFIPLQAFFLFSAFIQVVGVASIAPFIGILSNPDTIHTNDILSTFYSKFNFSSDNEFIITFAFLSLFLIFLSNLVTGLTLWLSFKFSIFIGNILQTELFSNLLRRPYIFHKITDHTQVIALVNQETPRFVYMVIQPLLILFSQTLVALVILIGLFILNPVIAISAGMVIGGSYFLTYVYLRKGLKHHGRIISQRNEGVQSTLSEAFLGVKEIKLGGNEKTYLDRFSNINRKGLVSSSFLILAGDVPKLVIETISFSAILMLSVVLLLSDTSSGEVIALLSLYSLAGYKLLPTMQQIYRSISNISANGQVVEKLYYELSQATDNDRANESKIEPAIDKIGLKNVSFSYPKATKSALNNITIEFTKGTINTIAGPSGSGKSTLADIVLGLLAPSSGFLTLNSKKLSDNKLKAYKSLIGYVPQHIFLTNDTIVANIAFGVSPDKVDISRVKHALKLANADTFTNALPDGIYSNLGQDGKLLSGGQRQRIGIARALYQDARILLLDEPTSALDIESEHDLMKTLQSLKINVLIIIISHRPAAIKMSDNITIIKKGCIVANGPYNELKKDNAMFKKLMKINRVKELDIKPAT